MSELRKLRNALMLSQSELSDLLDIEQPRISEAERGENDWYYAEILRALENPSAAFLHHLIRLVKFNDLVRSTGLSQKQFADMIGFSEGSVSTYLYRRKKISDSRWETILERLETKEPETTPEHIKAALEISQTLRTDEGFLLKSELENRNIRFGDFANAIGVSSERLSVMFVTEYFSRRLRERVDKALKEMQ